MNNTLVPPAAKASALDMAGADIFNDDDQRSVSPALQIDTAAEKALEEDGPLFRATINQLEGKTAALKSAVKRILKAAIASMEAQRASLEADEAFLKVLRDTPALDSLTNSYLDSASPYIQSQRYHLQNSMQALLIDPLRKLYETDVKAAETKRRQFDEESKDYYAHLSKYLSLKSEKQKARRHSEYESRHSSKRKQFGLARFDYHAFMQDLHGGRKENQILQHLTNYYEKEYSFYQSVASKLSNNRAELEKLHTAIDASSKEDSQLIKERKERRSLLEQQLSLPETQLERIPSEIVVPSGLRRSMDDNEASLQSAECQNVGAINLEQDKFKGFRDLEQLDRSIPIATGRRKEGFLFSTSRPSKSSAFDVAAANWHK
jgi:Arf-GAP/SH3 domain/ANK repeat/PH domain-containing protein